MTNINWDRVMEDAGFCVACGEDESAHEGMRVPRETRDHFHHYDDSWCAVCWTKFDPGTTGECPECGGSIYTAEELREMYP